MARSNRSHLAALARINRHAPTLTEAILWQELRSKKLGASFRRQVSLAGFITDFYASNHKLVVEVDGPYHARRVRPDGRRDRELAKRGYRVLRLPAELVLHALPKAVAAVRAALAP